MNATIQGEVELNIHSANPETPDLEGIQTDWKNVGLELLVDLSKKGEIDPWDVDLIYVIDKFLAETQQEGSLKEAAEIIFFVSVLLRIKSEHIYQKQEELPEEDYFDDLIDFEELGLEGEDSPPKITPESLDEVLVRNQKTIKESRRRKITLNDLIELFQTVQKPRKIRKKQKISVDDFDLDDDIAIREDEDMEAMDLAHDENLEEKIKKLSDYILEILEMDKLTLLKEVEKIMGSPIDTFLSALFLSHSGKTEIVQGEFYKEVWLKRIA